MKLDDLRVALSGKELSIGSWLMFDHALMTELIATSGLFDWLVVDLEHGEFDFESMVRQVQVIDLAGCVPIVRVGSNDPYSIKRALDAGANGIIVPNIRSADEAKRAVEAIYYPPRGNRGVGLFRAQGFGYGFDEYCRTAERGLIFIPQIEHHEGVSAIDDILAVEGVSGFIVGPYDLSASVGRPGDFEHPDVSELIERLLVAMRDNPKPGGFHVVHPDADQLEARVAAGARLLAYGIDMLFVGEVLKRERVALDRLRGEHGR